MNNRIYKEQLFRIHRLLYNNKSYINEQEAKIDDPKKADLVSKNVEEFFKTLTNAANSGGLTQQKRGEMQYQKAVESMQIGLTLLGYGLPRHGVDGLFGSETAQAVEKFIKDNNVSATISEAMTQLKMTSYPNLKFDFDGTHNDYVNSGLLDDINKAAKAANVVATITTAKHGHGYLTKSGVKSRHMDGTGVDVAIINGIGAGGATNSNNGNPKFKELGNKLSSALESMGYSRNVERGNEKAVLWQTNTGGNHYNHLHISNTKGASDLPISTLSTTNVTATPEMLNKLIELLRKKNISSQDLQKYIDSVSSGGSAEFTDVDLSTDEGYNLYRDICQTFIETRGSNLLRITGDMLAKAAKMTYENYQKYIPPELALAQLTQEGGFSSNPSARPIRTKNPFNVGNVDSGKNIYHGDVQSGINAYYDLIARRYMISGRNASDLIQSFVNKNNNRYATDTNYEKSLQTLVGKINRVADRVVASRGIKNNSTNV
jgi:hypothetical protein